MAAERPNRNLRFVGKVVIWRCWNLDPDPTNPKTVAAVQNVRLRPRYQDGKPWEMVEEAACNTKGYDPASDPEGLGPSEQRDHPVPYQGCNCGLFGFSNLEDLYIHTQLDSLEPVYGTMQVWGRMMFHQNGLRVQFAWPRLLVLNPASFASPEILDAYKTQLEEFYRCRVVLSTPLDFFKQAKNKKLDVDLDARVDEPLDMREYHIPSSEVNVADVDWAILKTNPDLADKEDREA